MIPGKEGTAINIFPTTMDMNKIKSFADTMMIFSFYHLVVVLIPEFNIVIYVVRKGKRAIKEYWKLY